MSRLSPVEMDCPACGGVGRQREDPFKLCQTCDGPGKTWRPGAPAYGCKMTLRDRKVGEIVTLGNDDRGRILAHDRREPPVTRIALIGDFDGRQSQESTSYPSCVGVVSVADPRFFKDDSSHADEHEDVTDPMRKRKM